MEFRLSRLWGLDQGREDGPRILTPAKPRKSGQSFRRRRSPGAGSHLLSPSLDDHAKMGIGGRRRLEGSKRCGHPCIGGLSRHHTGLGGGPGVLAVQLERHEQHAPLEGHPPHNQSRWVKKGHDVHGVGTQSGVELCLLL